MKQLKKRMLAIGTLALSTMLLCSCGQRGPLYLPPSHDTRIAQKQDQQKETTKKSSIPLLGQ